MSDEQKKDEAKKITHAPVIRKGAPPVESHRKVQPAPKPNENKPESKK